MLPSARRPLRVQRWDGYAQVSENQKNTSPLDHSRGAIPPPPPPIGTVDSPRTSSNAAPNTTRLFWD